MTNSSEEMDTSKPYKLIPFPDELPSLKPPAGHDKFLDNCLHGTLFLTLTVKTPLHISTGVVVMGEDISNSSIPLIQTMTQGVKKELIIQGSSLKGCIRAVYEALTNSTLGVASKEVRDNISNKKRLPCLKKEELCPASRIFGAMNCQGLVKFTDAKCEQVYSIGFMPSLYSPQPQFSDRTFNSEYFDDNEQVRGRKFYYQTNRAIDSGEKGISVQQAGTEYIFTTSLQFMNLKSEELGTLLIILGQDPQYPIALKVGAGKPIGMGTMTVEITETRVIQGKKELCDRYSTYTPPETEFLTGSLQQEFIEKQIKAAKSNLIEITQLEELKNVLGYPTNRQPPEGVY
ncbi:CRISPR-associated protein [Aphanothece hegewaldii CCALA 016]|uniref:CRISPR-associated protein n=1 Tax=Aphanothece hegewaldii CCALA 016 TaxID=2107694 RepID=A0A2T1LYC5_9CHRO|nr:RAMP superfamily CRISPR-associated protein [Aphanothece hegewaldii]PSF37389.1 CRISPR-associated protein [Aphanothece hegewaldii CCALA 016]